MSGILVIGESERRRIARIMRQARKRPRPWTVMQHIALSAKPTLMLNERRPGIDHEKILAMYPSFRVMLGTYRAQFSFEEQPAGLFRHLSVSSEREGMVPNEAVMTMVAEAFGFSGWPPTRASHVWAEEYEPGRLAINVTEIEP